MIPSTMQINKCHLCPLLLCLILYMRYKRVTGYHMWPKNRRNPSMTSCLVFFSPSQASIRHLNHLNLSPFLIWAILTHRYTWKSTETNFVTFSCKQRCSILRWVLCIFTTFFCLLLSPGALLTSLPLAALVFWPSLLARDAFFIISPLSLASLSRARTTACLVVWHFPLLLTLPDLRGPSPGPAGLRATEDLSLQPIPSRLVPSRAVTQSKKDSPGSESLLTFLLLGYRPQDLFLSLFLNWWINS